MEDLIIEIGREEIKIEVQENLPKNEVIQELPQAVAEPAPLVFDF